MPEILIASDVFDNNGKVKSEALPEGFGGSTDWANIQNKPATFSPSAHNHNSLYYSKSEIDEMTFGGGGGGLTSSQVKALIASGVAVIDAKEFGVTADGSTDDSDFLQAAIDEATAQFSNYATRFVLLPAGTIKVTKTVHLGYGTHTSSIILVGAGGYYPYDVDYFRTRGTTIKATFGDKAIINIQGALNTVVKGITFQGINNLTANSPGYTADMLVEANYLTTGNVDTRYGAGCAISIDYYCAFSNPSGGWNNAPDGWAKAASSHVTIDDCQILNVPVGIGSHLGGSDFQGEFISVRNTSIKYCKWGASIGNSQARQTEFINCYVDYVWCPYANNVHGAQQGRIVKIQGGHVSGYKLFSLGNMSINGPLSVEGLYSETLYKIGEVGGINTGSSHVSFRKCNLLLSGQESTSSIPVNILNGGTVEFDGGTLIGLCLDMDLTAPPIFTGGFKLINYVTYQYDRTYHFTNNVNVFKNSFRHHPVSFGDAQTCYSSRGVQAVLQNAGPIDTWNYDENEVGTNAFKYVDTGRHTYGLSGGPINDYTWATKQIGVAQLENRVLSGLTLTCTINDLGSALFLSAIRVGAILYLRDSKLKFMLTARSGNDFTWLLLKGFTFNPYSNPSHQFVGYNFDPATIWTGGFWIYNTNFYDVKATVATSNGSTGVLTVAYPFASETYGSPPAAEAQFSNDSIVSLYKVVNGALQTPQSGVYRTKVNGTGSATVTINDVIPAGDYLIFSKWPFQEKGII